MPVYLDHNATTPVRPEAREALLEALDRCGNASAVHAMGRDARSLLEEARTLIARCVKARPADVVFTSGGTESDNMAIDGAIRGGGITHIFHPVGDHEAVANFAATTGLPVELIPIGADGVIDLDWLQDRLDAFGESERALVCLHAANNESGVIQPFEQVGRMVREAGGLFHIDAVQALGKIPFDFAASGAHYAAVSAHKVGGPQGIGALFIACDAPFEVLRKGGGQEQGRRSGTSNVGGAWAFAKALEACLADTAKWDEIRAWRDEMESRLAVAEPGISFLGQGAPRLPNTSAVCMPGWQGSMQVIALDLAGFCVSAGSACSSGRAAISPTWSAMAGEEKAGSTIRVSLGWNTTKADVDAFVSAWIKEFERVKPRLKEMA
ncbi:cysteine desulfurase family protein [Hyphobacterium sp. HN65]|uniref:Cysteine desulfurase n=1 Tax=Hyphobacterium lacteum TaxID=3116575 RepID=A0ABU7LLL8_9PROT|nr:cysteine desulfurase family protein [Hyphobacterium sp. HN65]MEE2524828.1 cysteine desulfurase family protein [Hyphobacterium sp. HN65]